MRRRRSIFVDGIYMLIVVAFFGLAIAYTHACDHL
jgi:hypothetical protein